MQPVAELVELSRRWAVDGREIRLNDAIAKGGTLRRTGSLRHRGRLQVRPAVSDFFFFRFLLLLLSLFIIILFNNIFPLDYRYRNFG